METVFISYSHKDGQWVRDWLLPRLEGAGVRVRIDFRDFEVGQPGIINMEKAIDECKRTFLVITPHWIESQWTNFEALVLQTDDPTNRRKRLIPLLLEPCELPKRLSMFTYADFTGETGREAQLGRLLGQMGVTYTPGAAVKAYVRPVDEAISLYRLPVTGKDLFGRERESAFLDAAWADGNTHIVTLTAWGGVGKTALVNQWLNHMQQKNYGGARRVFGWSFYSQGSEEGKQASADEFLQETLEWFGDTDPNAGSNVEKGRRLARLVRNRKILLILDGLEPLQYPPGEVHGFDGKLKDPGMAVFLKELAAACPGDGGGEGSGGGCGLCVVTTREGVTDLAHKTGYAVKEVMLEALSEKAGAALLRGLGVTTGTDADVSAAVKEYGGHALALTLLGNYISSAHGGDIRKRDKIPRLTGERLKGGHARRVMDAYERWLGESVERDILYIMGLFDRPAEAGAVETLKSAPAIPGVTDHLPELSEEDWEVALSNLRTARLLGEADRQKRGTPGTLDCHPLVREHFGERLRAKNPGGWQAAHRRLYHYFKDLPEKKYKKELPDTLAEMGPLFAAVAHGCKAGLHREALDEVYWKRIKRGDEHYCTKKLGAFGSDLAALSHFFDVPWRQPAAGLPEADKALVLSWAAFRLRAVGRLREAVRPMKAGLEMREKQEVWKSAAMNASNLSALMLTLGEVTAAVDYGRRSVTHADRSKDEFMMEVTRTILADALHQSGQFEEAEKWFREAEAMQKKRRPYEPLLYSLQGFRFCDLLLEKCPQGTYKEVMERAEKALEIAKQSGLSLLTIALDHLTLGRAWMIRAKNENSGDFSRAMAFLETAVTGLRKAGDQDYLSLALIKRAECYRRMRAFSKAREDLDEAQEIAETGDMKLYLCDYHLEAGKLCRDEKNDTDANQHFQTAEKLIEETGYFRRRRRGVTVSVSPGI
ncbi:MAG: TIR domain-containing protein [bacterium]|nr:TIR domain-containing protein [bacterium]